ncbi:hypothetical protein ACFS5N_14520 [Mucilaginibacter ximonensis]|uniref:Tetratricopeptide repeat protein n=1 Tax=Mucilaginibacter ximonensis TaxID=538021 RepID=A0ABW5YEI9_9SPHI
MQNVTAAYNILYNADEILRQKQETYANSYIDQYSNILSVYRDTLAHNSGDDKDLDAVIFRANTIINEKEQSKFVGTAYLVMGKANYLKGKYFDAVELFSYVIRSYPANIKLTQEAYAWKIRSLLYLNNNKEAKGALDSAFQDLDPKKPKQHLPAAIYAAALQYNINTQNYADAEVAAKNAIAYTGSTDERLRWTFILGQLQELNRENDEALKSYNSIVKSNASFEMAFNAQLNRIRLQEMRNGIKVNRVDLLLSLLRDQNNIDFNDQIYFQVAEIYAANKDISSALKYYRLSARSSLKNQNQKGLAYMRIADIDFNQKADYVGAKKYYDSTLINLSPNYPDYKSIQKKSNNLQLLVNKLQIIAREDTLQSLARLNDADRAKAIDSLVNEHILQERTATAATYTGGPGQSLANNPFAKTPAQPTGQAATGSSFYFYNAAAVSQGYNDFKRRWGDRKLTDNWRHASKNDASTSLAGNPTVAQQPSSGLFDPDATVADIRKSASQASAGNYRQQLLQNLPVTPALLAQSNARIYNAYLDMANFYRDVLEEKKDAIANYELLLNKFPNQPDKAPIYYSLYRLYSNIDPQKSADYKNRILKEYGETVYAKVIIDPDYAKKLGDKDAQLNEAYNQVYNLYSRKNFAQVIISADSLLKQYPGNKYAAQIYYLRTIASGHLEKVASFRDELQQIAIAYPGDPLITPLVKQHLIYVDANLPELTAQPFAIMGTDTTMFSPPVENHEDAALNRNRQFVAVTEKPVEPAAITTKADTPTAIKTPLAAVGNTTIKKADTAFTAKAPVTKPTDTTSSRQVSISQPSRKIPHVFNERDSTNYFFVVDVSTGTTDLSSSRFGIGQYNRINFQFSNIVHRLKNAGPDNQLIYVGPFRGFDAAKTYARGIIPLMAQIMKVPADKYSFFIATKQNLDKLADKKMLDDYIEYYQQTLLK